MKVDINLQAKQSYDTSEACYHHVNLTRTCRTSQIRGGKAASKIIRQRAKTTSTMKMICDWKFTDLSYKLHFPIVREEWPIRCILVMKHPHCYKLCVSRSTLICTTIN